LTVLRQLLLLPLLAPLLAVIVIGALNPKPAVSLRLLTYTSPPLPIGVWMMLAAAGGGLLSAGATGLALRSGSGNLHQRQVRLPLGSESTWAAWPAPANSESPPAGPNRQDWTSKEPQRSEPVAAGPSRAPGEPAPTVEVPFRVIRRASSSNAAGAETPAGSPPVVDWDDSGSDW
jgi:uncharacterized integral membrane protein